VVALTAAPAFAASPTTGDFGAHFIETTMNGAFIQVGYSKVKSSTHKVTSIVPTGSGVIVTADLTFAVNAQLFSGSGTYTFGQSGAVQTIVVDASVANVDGSRLIDFDYTSVNDLANLQLDEDLTVYQTGGAVSLYSVDKTKNLVLTGNQEVRTITATVDRDGDVDNVWISQVTDEITPSNFARSTLYQSNARSAQVDYSMTFSADDEMSVSFSRYDVIEGGRSYSLDPGSSSYVNTSKATATAYDTSYRLALVNDSTGKVWRATSSGTAQIGLGEAFTEGGGWSWKAFGKSTATGAAGGAAGGAVVGGISTDSAAPIGAGAGAAVGAVGGAVGGAAAYTAGKLWDWAFGCDDDDEAATASCGGPVPHQPIDHRKPGADERTVVVIGPIQPITPIGSFSTGNSTYFSGHADFSHFEWDVTGTAK
jgi:hypothetical protein